MDRVAPAAHQENIRLGVRRPTADDAKRAGAMLAEAQGKPLLSLAQLYAYETVQMEAWLDQIELVLQVLRIGDVGMVAIPCETFVEVGLKLKEKSPFKPTLVVDLANGYNGYLPTADHDMLGGHETWRARSSYLETGAASSIADRLLVLFAQLK